MAKKKPDFRMDDEHNFYRAVAFDVLKDAWNEYKCSVKRDALKVYKRRVQAQETVLKQHGFSEKEIQQLIKDSTVTH